MFLKELLYSQHFCNTVALLPKLHTHGLSTTPLVSVQFKHTKYALCGLAQYAQNSHEFYLNVGPCSCEINAHSGVQHNPQYETVFHM